MTRAVIRLRVGLGRRLGQIILLLILSSGLPAIADANPRKICPRDTRLKQTNVRKGETLLGLSMRLNVKVDDLKRWNRLKSDRVRVGQNLRYCQPVWKPTSMGSPNSGQLKGGVHLDADGDRMGVGFVIAPGRKALFGTRDTVRHVKDCCARYRWKYAKAPPINIGDLSSRDGGHLGNHLSHQSGRDIDLGFLTKPPQSKGFFNREATRSNLDVPKQWFVVQCFLDKPETQYIFMSHDVFGALRDHVRKNKSLWHKYRNHFSFAGALRPDNEHRTHMHIRFRCPGNDKNCRD
jgi:murein endopeptidase